VLVFLSGEKRNKIRQKLVLMIILLPTIFLMASYQTDSILFRRYVNKNVNGLPKGPEVNGRKHLIMEEIKFFKENPMLGMGVGRTKEIRKVKHGSAISNHNEITRLLAEHGLLGVLSLIILLSTPLLLYIKNKKNIFLLAFLGFWLLTISHSATRIAAPAFIYVLALLQINFNGKDSIIENDSV
jgi:O-antigen ligase